ncbi:hypothetical protein GCM10020255_094880 [Rhodococcus baikonurensis]
MNGLHVRRATDGDEPADMDIFRKVVEKIDRDDAAQAVADQNDLARGGQMVKYVPQDRSADRFLPNVLAYLLQIQE